MVQCTCPDGAGEQAKATRCASASPSIRLGRCEQGKQRSSAAARLCSTNCWRTRPIVVVLTSSASLICSSVQAGPSGLASALSKMRACRSLRAAAFPAEIIWCRDARSSVVSFTIYFLFMSFSLPLRSVAQGYNPARQLLKLWRSSYQAQTIDARLEMVLAILLKHSKRPPHGVRFSKHQFSFNTFSHFCMASSCIPGRTWLYTLSVRLSLL